MGRIAKNQNKTRIAVLRERMGWSQEYLGGIVGCTREYINLLENRKKNNPSVIMIKKIAHALGTPVNEVIKDLGL